MATYFNRYYFEFTDSHHINPVVCRVDILDSQGVAPTTPIQITPSGVPLLTERIDVSEDKSFAIIGRQITISYEVRDNPTDPLPDEFFDADERRYKVEVRKNGELDGVYYIKPDFCQFPDQHPPFTVQLKAIDGIGYSKGQLFNVDDGSGKLLYDKISLYESIMTRALNLILEPGTKINVLNSLAPSNIESGVKLLFGTFIHTDIFYDFVEGAKNVYDVLKAFCESFYARIFIEDGQVWFIRTQDLTNDTFVLDQYTDPLTVNEVPMLDFVRTVGPSAAYDCIPVNVDGNNSSAPAIKKAEFETDYQGINQLKNFDWSQWNGTSFTDWTVEPTFPLVVSRTGSGTLLDQYKLFIPYPQAPTATDIQQEHPVGDVFLGDTFDLELRYRFTNVKAFKMSVSVTNNNSGGVSFRLLTDGSWVVGNSLAGLFTITRGGKKREGTLKIKSLPIPIRVEGTPADQLGPFGLRVEFFAPFNPETMEPGEPAGVEIYPVKLGVYSIPSKGRHIRVTNDSEFSQVKEPVKFTFIDTGEDGVSNTIFTGAAKVPANEWSSSKPGIISRDIEAHMAAAHIDQYQRSVRHWEGTLFSNSLKFRHVLEFASKPGKRFMQLSDTYSDRECEHSVVLAEVWPEGTSQFRYEEWDIEEEKEQ